MNVRKVEETKHYHISPVCSKCGEVMIHDVAAEHEKPAGTEPLYAYRCPHCKNIEYSNITYPREEITVDLENAKTMTEEEYINGAH